jgi:hypothetical protein
VEGAKVATNPNELTPEPGTEDGSIPEDETPNPEVNDQEQDEGDDTPSTPSVEELASRMGWRPKEEYDNPDKPWKPAHEFILFTHELERNRHSEIRGLKSQLDVMAKTTADILKDRLEAQRAELTSKYNELVEEGDAAGAFKVSQRLVDIDRRVAQPQPVAPTPEGQEFAQRNASWFGQDQAATLRAIEITNKLAAQGKSNAEQLQAAERIVRNEFPERFTDTRNGQRQPPAVHRPGSRSPAPSNRSKTFADLPAENQKVARDMVSRGVIPDTDAYLKYYLKNAEGKR